MKKLFYLAIFIIAFASCSSTHYVLADITIRDGCGRVIKEYNDATIQVESVMGISSNTTYSGGLKLGGAISFIDNLGTHRLVSGGIIFLDNIKTVTIQNKKDEQQTEEDDSYLSLD